MNWYDLRELDVPGWDNTTGWLYPDLRLRLSRQDDHHVWMCGVGKCTPRRGVWWHEFKKPNPMTVFGGPIPKPKMTIKRTADELYAAIRAGKVLVAGNHDLVINRLCRLYGLPYWRPVPDFRKIQISPLPIAEAEDISAIQFDADVARAVEIPSIAYKLISKGLTKAPMFESVREGLRISAHSLKAEGALLALIEVNGKYFLGTYKYLSQLATALFALYEEIPEGYIYRAGDFAWNLMIQPKMAVTIMAKLQIVGDGPYSWLEPFEPSIVNGRPLLCLRRGESSEGKGFWKVKSDDVSAVWELVALVLLSGASVLAWNKEGQPHFWAYSTMDGMYC